MLQTGQNVIGQESQPGSLSSDPTINTRMSNVSLHPPSHLYPAKSPGLLSSPTQAEFVSVDIPPPLPPARSRGDDLPKKTVALQVPRLQGKPKTGSPKPEHKLSYCPSGFVSCFPARFTWKQEFVIHTEKLFVKLFVLK